MCAAAPPPGATNCSGCHAVGGSASELAATMLAYRSGERASTVMGRLMKGLTAEQIQEIAVWVAAQK